VPLGGVRTYMLALKPKRINGLIPGLDLAATSGMHRRAPPEIYGLATDGE
jgi:hypothetical protein